MLAFHRLSLLLALAIAACRPVAQRTCFEPASKQGQSEADQPLRVALTVDDLPGGYEAFGDYPKSRVMREIVAALSAHRVPAVGFVNGIYAETDADAREGLKAWLAAGLEVANHTYSHRSASELDVSAFLADVRKNRAYLESVAPERPVRFVRFPFLERGRNREQRIAITQALARDGYRVANVSIDFADWAFVPAFARCALRADTQALRALSAGYLEHAKAALFWSEESAQRLFGRAIPHVLLLHAQAATAHNIEALLADYERAGVKWITLDEALSDAVYTEPPDRDHGDTPVLAEAMRASSRPPRSFVPRSLELLDLACR